MSNPMTFSKRIAAASLAAMKSKTKPKTTPHQERPMSQTVDLSITLAPNSGAAKETVKVSVTFEDPRNAVSALAQIAKREYLSQLWATLVQNQWDEDEDDTGTCVDCDDIGCDGECFDDSVEG